MTIEERNTAKAIQDIAKELKEIRYENEKPLIIDWEYRRYEIARDMQTTIIQGLYQCASPELDWAKLSAQRAVKCADALIEELKKK